MTEIQFRTLCNELLLDADVVLENKTLQELLINRETEDTIREFLIKNY